MVYTRRQLLVTVGAFLAGWSSVGVRLWWEDVSYHKEGCAFNLRLVYATIRTLSAGGNMREVTVEQVATVLLEGIRFPSQLDAYIRGRPSSAQDEQGNGSFYMRAQAAFVCPSDPEYAIKVVMSRTPMLGFESSYRLFADPNTVAYCPIHRMAVRVDGTLRRD